MKALCNWIKLFVIFSLVSVELVTQAQEPTGLRPEESDKIAISTEDGLKITNHLKASLQTASTTSCRKEQKSVISDRTWRMIRNDLKRGYPFDDIESIPLVARDGNPNGGKNSTFTFYGKGAIFANGTVQTNFILRTRFYIELYEKAGKLEQIKRSPLTANCGWMEIKVRNPSSEEFLGVNKYRIKVKDEDILALYAANPEDPTFDALIGRIKENAKLDPENKEAEVEAFFDVVGFMGKKDPSFIQPQIAVSYERTAYKHNEAAYPLGVAHKTMAVEYQITADKNVTYLQPAIDFNKGQLDLVKYYAPQNPHILAKYPERTNAVEFKDPFPVANFPEAKRSKTHGFFYSDLMDPMHSDAFILPGFIKNKGKAGHYRTFKQILKSKRAERSPLVESAKHRMELRNRNRDGLNI